MVGTGPQRVVIVGYGLAGRVFHGPLVAATPGLEVAAVVTADPGRAQTAAAAHPDAQIVPELDAALELAPDLVVVATGNAAHVSTADAAIERGIPVVVDKPIANSAREAAGLVSRAAAAGVLLTVFQNRRWDTDQLTLRRVIAEGALGEITRYESRFERWRPEPRPEVWREALPTEEGGGLLLDLGAHLVDQAIGLFGAVGRVYAEIAARRGTPGEDDVFLALEHQAGTTSHLWASALAAAPAPRLRVLGTDGAFLAPGVDPQEDQLAAGLRPGAAGWGLPPEWEAPRLCAGEQSVPVPPELGDWPRFYALMRAALAGEGAVPVDPGDAVAALQVLEAARESARTGTVVSPQAV